MMKQAQRHQEIIELLSQCGFASTEELVTHFDVSPQTIRRDLNELAEQNKIQRHHGGASLSTASSGLYTAHQVPQLAEKERIAHVVAARIPDGASLFIDIGSSCEAVARALLDHRDLRIVTNNLNVASILTARDDFTVIIAGGEIRSRDGGIVGEATRDFISQFRMDYGVMGIAAIDASGDLLSHHYQEVRVTQAIMEHSRTLFLLADHSKFGRQAMVNLGAISLVDVLFTDAEPPQTLCQLMHSQKVVWCVC
jgi:DeoR family transcriptional regulator, glycerol-3-phosphate regulon repressor